MGAREYGLFFTILSACSVASCSPSSDDGAEEGNLAATADDSACALATNSGGVIVGTNDPGMKDAPEPASGFRTGMKPSYAKRYMVVTANPLASKAGCEILKKGGSAADAAVAVQMVLGLVEPQSSGVGGGAVALYYDAAKKVVTAYDGRETAPRAATGNYLQWISDADHGAPKPNARASGRSIGTPGAVRMLDLVHRDQGKLPWKDLFQPAIGLADGFAIGGRMAAAIATSLSDLRRDPEAAAYFLNADGSAKAHGTLIKNPAYKTTLGAIADGGPDAFYSGSIANGIVSKIKVSSGPSGEPITPGVTEASDLSGYQAKRRDPVCVTYRAYWVCTMAPPSAGGIAVAETLGILENFPMSQYAPAAADDSGGKASIMGVHLIAEAERLAYADRDKYVADTDFIPLPKDASGPSMLGKAYLKQRAGLINPDKSMGVASAGNLGDVPLGVDQTPEHGTSHVTIVDKDGNSIVMTTTVEGSLGSFHMTQGFMLNNQLTDFSASPADKDGKPIANRVAPGKRPRSSMAPTLVFQKAPDGSRGELFMSTGSPGGGTIIQYVVKTLVGVIDWKLDAQQATALLDFGASNSATTNVGGEHPSVDARDGGSKDPLVIGLRAKGHDVSVAAQSSGIGTIVRKQVKGASALEGGADPRREGVALGDTFTP
jgi:gamma-glutamyltranspeptidase/glutathione hydrolase